VSCLQKLRRGLDFSEEREYGGPYKKVWRREALEPRVGILIGYRTLMDVRVHNSGQQSVGRPLYFDVVRRQRAALVVFNGAENPVYVPVDAMAAA
jgi:hypothetical protein